MVDFKEAGELTIFIDEEQLQALEKSMSHHGYLDGRTMATTFNLLRANDLIWSFVVNNYLLGREPFPFDLLYWNGDSTRMPAKMHSFYLREMYQRNNLCKKGGIKLKGQPIDLTSITTPTFILSTREDHIAPWVATYASTQIYQGEVDFVLAGSGHIAGVVNPPTNNKYGYWTNESLPAHPADWLKDAKQHEGSWWPYWRHWLSKHDGNLVPARTIKKALCPAPGEYVLVKS
jgi:polyhydroxyalkanoate synthase